MLTQSPNGGRSRIRTYDPLIKSQLLYQLSYAPACAERVHSKCRPGCEGQAPPRCEALPGVAIKAVMADPPLIDFTAGALVHRLRSGAGRGGDLARAIRIRPARMPHVVDATAGLGRDAFVLASLGVRVTMIERSPPIHAALAAAMAESAGRPAGRGGHAHAHDADRR